LSKLKYFISAMLLTIGGLVLVLISTTLGDGYLKSVINNISSALMISGVLGLIDQYILKNEMINYIISKVSLKKSVDLTGLTDLQYGSDQVPYKEFLETAKKKIDVVHLYGQTWTKTHTGRLITALRDTNVEIRVVLMDPLNIDLINIVSPMLKRVDSAELINRIETVSGIWKDIYTRSGVSNPDRIKIYYHSNIQTVALYRFDDNLVCRQLHISKHPNLCSSPTLICKKGSTGKSIFNVYMSDIEQLIKDSRNVPITSIT